MFHFLMVIAGRCEKEEESTNHPPSHERGGATPMLRQPASHFFSALFVLVCVWKQVKSFMGGV